MMKCFAKIDIDHTRRGVVLPREGGCSTGDFDSLIICSLWKQMVKLMAKWNRASATGFQGV